jgi:head-tail adaptor
MALIAPQTSIADRPHRVTLRNPVGPGIPDGDGGTTQVLWEALVPPASWAQIEGRAVERGAAGTVVAPASYTVTLPYHPQVTTQTQLSWDTRLCSVISVSDPGARHVELVLECVELVAVVP